MKITLVRHTSVAVEKGVCYGQTDVPLRSTFPQEAEIVRQKLSGKSFDAAFTSPLSRCTLLAEYCGYADAIRDARLMEMNFGAWEMQRFNDISDPNLQQWYGDWFHTAATGGESSQQQQQRLRDFYSWLQKQSYRNVIIFTHGGILMHSLILTGRATLSNAFDLQPGYGGIIEIDALQLQALRP